MSHLKKSGGGGGKPLMRELLRYARQDLGLKSIKARVLSHNKRALKLYESFGFRATKELEGVVYISLNFKNS